jgi:membrane protein implicated in regulation of membrane protease activity
VRSILAEGISVGLLYLVALALGGGFLAVQFFLSAHDQADFHDLSGGTSDAGAGDHAGGWLSPRFFTFAAFAFGFAGSLLHFLSLASPVLTLGLSAAIGLCSGFLASGVFRALRGHEVSSSASLEEAGGQLGRVLLQCGPGQQGKVRVTIKGQHVDILATADGLVEQGTEVVVLDVKEQVARVMRAPEALRQ